MKNRGLGKTKKCEGEKGPLALIYFPCVQLLLQFRSVLTSVQGVPYLSSWCPLLQFTVSLTLGQGGPYFNSGWSLLHFRVALTSVQGVPYFTSRWPLLQFSATLTLVLGGLYYSSGLPLLPFRVVLTSPTEVNGGWNWSHSPYFLIFHTLSSPHLPSSSHNSRELNQLNDQNLILYSSHTELVKYPFNINIKSFVLCLAWFSYLCFCLQ